MIRFVWLYLPVFFIWFVGLSTLNNSLHHINPPLEIVRFLSFFPLTATLILLWYACRKEYSDRSAYVKYFIAWSVGLTVLYLTPFMHGLSAPLDERTQKLIYELSALAQFTILIFHARTWFSRMDWIWVFGVTLFFGIILENGGIALGFFFEPGFLLYAPGLPAPLATALGWANVLYCAFFAVERLLPQMAPVWKGLVCAFVGLSLDIPFDPVATRLGWWVWDRTLDAKIWGVPIINFIAWFWAIFPYTAVYYWVRENRKFGEEMKVFYFMGSFPVILIIELLGVVMSLMVTGDRAALLVFRRFFSSLCLF